MAWPLSGIPLPAALLAIVAIGLALGRDRRVVGGRRVTGWGPLGALAAAGVALAIAGAALAESHPVKPPTPAALSEAAPTGGRTPDERGRERARSADHERRSRARATRTATRAQRSAPGRSGPAHGDAPDGATGKRPERLDRRDGANGPTGETPTRPAKPDRARLDRRGRRKRRDRLDRRDRPSGSTRPERRSGSTARAGATGSSGEAGPSHAATNDAAGDTAPSDVTPTAAGRRARPTAAEAPSRRARSPRARRSRRPRVPSLGDAQELRPRVLPRARREALRRRVDVALARGEDAVRRVRAGGRRATRTTLYSKPRDLTVTAAGSGVTVKHLLIARDTNCSGERRFSVTWTLRRVSEQWSVTGLTAAAVGANAAKCR